jgi:hypothetical protein
MDPQEIERQIKDAVAAKMADVPKPAGPRDLELDAYEQLLIDNLLYRELAARRALELANRDLDEVAQLRRNLLQSLSAKHKVKDGWTVNVDFQKKAAKAIPPQK